MMKHKKWEQRCWDIGRAFFMLQGKKSSVPLGCVLAGIRYVAALAGMTTRRGLRLADCSAKTATQSAK